jgi:hypothetical protein
MVFDESFDVIVIGGGHAGCEAPRPRRAWERNGSGCDQFGPDWSDVL